MPLQYILVLAILTDVIASSSDAAAMESRESNVANIAPLGVPLWAPSIADANKRYLRAHGAREVESNDPNVKESRNDEDRAITTTKAIGMLGKAVKREADDKFWLFLGYSPEKVMALLKVTSSEDENFKRYSKYFFQYYVKYFDEPLEHFSPTTRESVMKARLHDWLEKTLTPPQVFTRLGLTGSWASARGQKNYKYFETYSRMYGGLQAREFKSINGL